MHLLYGGGSAHTAFLDRSNVVRHIISCFIDSSTSKFRRNFQADCFSKFANWMPTHPFRLAAEDFLLWLTSVLFSPLFCSDPSWKRYSSYTFSFLSMTNSGTAFIVCIILLSDLNSCRGEYQDMFQIDFCSFSLYWIASVAVKKSFLFQISTLTKDA